VVVGGIPATDLATRFGTPLYVYDAEVIRRRWHQLVDGIGRERTAVYYSCKANAALGIVRLLVDLGARLDACSPGDLAVARKAGCGPEAVSYLGVSVSDADLDAVVTAGAFFTADSLSQLERYADRCPPGTEIGLRINCDVAAGFHAHVQAGAWDAKFGLHPAQLPAALHRAAERGLRVTGLHSHVGSDILDPQPHLELLRRLLELSDQLPDLTFVNIGGGWGTPFLPMDEEYPMAEFGAAASSMLDDYERRRGRPVELRVEPGAYLVMDAGVLLASVVETKAAMPIDGRQSPTFVCVDSSYNHVVSAVIYNTYHPIELARDPAAPTAGEVSIVGNLMQAGDVLARDRPMPELAPGDVLVIRKCGGYTSSRSTVFNERPRPAEVVVDAGTATLIRSAETVDDLLLRDL
jgi:diaminopimelate decarboxylase